LYSYNITVVTSDKTEREREREREREECKRENDNGQEKLIILFFVNPKPPSFSVLLSVCQLCYMHRTDERLAPVCVLTGTVS